MAETPAHLLDEITARIVAEMSPDRVVLFGSQVWGEPAVNSDVDLLVVMETDDALAAEARIGRDCRPRKLPMDVLVKTPAEVAERLRLGDAFIRRIVERGRVLYERIDSSASGWSRTTQTRQSAQPGRVRGAAEWDTF